MRSGQTLVVVLLTLAIILTLGLSIASRSITEVNVSTVEDDSSRALNAAEAGVEAALGAIITPGAAIGVGSSTTTTYTVDSNDTGSGTAVVPAEKVRAGDGVTIFLSGRNPDGTLKLVDSSAFDRQFHVCWGDSASITQTTPAIELKVFYYDSSSGYGMGSRAYDPSSVRRSRNNFGANSSSGTNPCTTGERNYAFWVNNLSFASDFGVPGTARPLLLRMKLLYNGETGHFVGVQENSLTGNNSFPNQGKTISSTGASGTAVRKLAVFQRYSDFAPVFDGPLFSGTGGLVKP